MSISDMIVVMKAGVLQQIGKPQEVYDNPVNLFVAKFLGTPPINVFDGVIKNGGLYVGDDCIMQNLDIEEKEVYVAIRPEGFVLNRNGELGCSLKNVEIMGRDMSIVSENPHCHNAVIRSIIPSDSDISGLSQNVRFDIKDNKIFVFDKITEKRIDVSCKKRS